MDRADIPEAVRHPNGCVEPFEPERITRSLFAASERIGAPDPFLARELTESVLHFLAGESFAAETTPDLIADVVVKVVRELAHPELAKAYEARTHQVEALAGRSTPDPDIIWPTWLDPMLTPFGLVRAAAAEPLEAFSLKSVFPRDLHSAHLEGLIRLTSLRSPLELTGVVHTLSPDSVFEGVEKARLKAGDFFAVDGPEYDLVAEPGDPSTLADKFTRELFRASVACGITPILNLNVSLPPRLIEASGPLFARTSRADADRRRDVALALAERSCETGFHVWWHIAADSENDLTLQTLVGRSPEGRGLEFVFDRRGQPVQLGPGLDRQTPATLLIVGVNVGQLVEMMGGPPVDHGKFLGKVASLTRFAKTAGHAKLDFLRKHGGPSLREAFLLDRASLVLSPIGLSRVSQVAKEAGDDFSRDVLRTMRSAAENDRPRRLPIRVDCAFEFAREDWIPVGEYSWRRRIRMASMLQFSAAGGCLALQTDDPIAAIEAAAQSNIGRMRFRLDK